MVFCLLSKSHYSRIGGFLILSLLIISSFSSLITLSSVSAADPVDISFKWASVIGGGGEDVLTYDAIESIPGEEIFHAGGPLAPNSGGLVSCLNGQTGVTIWNRTIANVGDTCQIQMVDMDNNGDMEIVVPLQHPAGIYILHAENGVTMYSATNVGGGRIDGGAVAGDVDRDGYPDLYVAIMGYLQQPETGKIIHYEYAPSVGIVERGRVQVWHPCAGGLTLGDTDNDGTFELYMNERDIFYNDGYWGRGTASFWAENLTVRWQLFGWAASSNSPVLADVNKDGIQDVVTTDLSAGVCVLNSSDGRPLVINGVTLKQTNIPERHNHYQSTIYDIDGDGNLEILSGDGAEGGWDLVTVFDLYSWSLDKAINTTEVGGRSWKGPAVGEVTGDGVMDIIVTTFDNINYSNTGALQVYDNNYNLVYVFQNETGFKHRAIESVVQDIDDDGLNELLILSQGGILYCFDTPGIASSTRARSEVQGYSESRNYVSEFVPFDRPWPDVSAPSIGSGTYNVSTGLSQLSFTLYHPLGETMTYSVTAGFSVGLGSGSVGNEVVTVSVSGLAPSTRYSWQVSVEDESGHQTEKTYFFYTAPYITNSAPIHENPILSGGAVGEDLVCQSQSTMDIDDDSVTNVYNWYKNGSSFANLNLPLDIKLNADAVYSGLVTTRDYSGMNNTAQVFGATNTDGVVGGGLYFDGSDFIMVNEAVNGTLGGKGNWTEMSAEFWIRVPNSGETEKLLWKPNRYNTSLSSYAIDVRKTDSALTFAWTITSGSSKYTLSYDHTKKVADWHHVVCTYESGSGLRIYVDGIESAADSNPAIAGLVNGTNGPLQIASNIGYSDFAGYLDEIRIYPIALSQTLIEQRYLETKDGLSEESTIPNSDAQEKAQWMCEVTPNDGLIDGATLASETITAPPNSAPVVSNLQISPALPTSDKDLVAQYTYSDADNDPEANSVVFWYLNGAFVTTGKVLGAGNTSVGDVWTFTVMPSDGFDNGETAGPSNPVTIINTAPVVSNLQISPTLPTSDKDLVAQYTYSDSENDPEVNSVVSWYLNGAFVTTGKVLGAGNTSVGDVWTFYVIPNDGFVNGTTAGPSNPVTIANTQTTEPSPTPTTSASTSTPTTSNPTSKPTVKPTPNTTPSVPEGLTTVLLIVLAVTLLLAIFTKKTQLKKPLTNHQSYHY